MMISVTGIKSKFFEFSDILIIIKMNKQQQCAKNGENRRKQTFAKVFNTIELLKQKKKPITLKSVAKGSGVSLSWFYKQPEMRTYIELLGEQTSLVEEDLVKNIQQVALKIHFLENCYEQILYKKFFSNAEKEKNNL